MLIRPYEVRGEEGRGEGRKGVGLGHGRGGVRTGMEPSPFVRLATI